jgi:predicted dienelactone hydrolase
MPEVATKVVFVFTEHCKNRSEALASNMILSSLQQFVVPTSRKSYFPSLLVLSTAGILANSITNNCRCQAMMSSSSSSSSSSAVATTQDWLVYQTIYGLPPGPYSVGVTTTQFTDVHRVDPGDKTRKRGLQTEIWYPCHHHELSGRNKFSDFVGLKGILDRKEKKRAMSLANMAFGGYRDGLNLEELDNSVWINRAIRDAKPVSADDSSSTLPQFPLIVFSHGSGAYRASYIYWCEYLASHGYVVAACDHPGSARFTVVDGRAIVPDNGSQRSKRSSMEYERPLDINTVIDGMQHLSQTDSRFQGTVDCQNVGVTGMSFGGYTIAAYLELHDPRVKAAIIQCPSIATSGTQRLATDRVNTNTPVMVMLGQEDTVIGERGNQAGRDYVDHHRNGDSYLLEIVRGGHVSFTSCDIYDENYGNGIGATKECPSLSQPGMTYKPLDITDQHKMINSYGLAFLNAYLKDQEVDKRYLQENHFEESGELIYRTGQ